MLDNGNEIFGNGGLDLGSSDIGTGFDGFTPFEDDAEIDKIFGNSDNSEVKSEDAKKDETVSVTVNASEGQPITHTVMEETETEVKQNENGAKPEGTSSATNDNDSAKSEETSNFFAEAITQAEVLQAESRKNGLIEKLPIFVYGNAKEEIVDTSKTFDALRIEKAEDFPELDDSASVSWKMNYGTISKVVSTPEKTTIVSLKKQIEESKAFENMLKKAKGDVVCEVKPSVVAKKKGIQSSYKGAFLSMTDFTKSGKVIAFVPSDDGNVYEVRSNKIGTFIAKTEKAPILEKVRAGFIPALPKIPYKILAEVISFFKSYVSHYNEFEALAYIYWSVVDSKYYVHIPRQQVSKMSVDSTLPEIDEDKFPLVMEIHSHNTMSAAFSPIDNKDEQATRFYAVIGRLDNFFPDIKVRFSVGGKFVEIDPGVVFEGMSCDFPEKWNEAVEKGVKL